MNQAERNGRATDMVGTDVPVNGNEAAHTVERLLQYGLQKGLLHKWDVNACRNALLDVLQLTEPYADAGAGVGVGAASVNADIGTGAEAGAAAGAAQAEDEGKCGRAQLDSAVELLEILLDYAADAGILEHNTTTYRDLLDAKIMGLLMPRPSEVIREFEQIEKKNGIESATDRFYALSIDSNYIRMDRVSKNLAWLSDTEYGPLEITINVSKPEKDPKEIALLRTMKASGKYPKCLLCPENVGYAGRLDHPARQNLRVLPMTLDGEGWYLQYSPYVYYTEHCIVLHGNHVPMKMSERTFRRLLDFSDRFPHYFIGSNADLPIVGGSILDHDHFQGGRHSFPMEKAPVEQTFTSDAYPGVVIGMPKWPMSVIRLIGKDKSIILRLANDVYESWKNYSDLSVNIMAYTDQGGERVPHNTVTPIVRTNSNGEYEIDLVLRNNRTDEAHPDGIFHPHQHLHHIKKENIGLIEVMGLAVLPARLQEELRAIAAILTGEVAWDGAGAIVRDAEHALNKHAAWIEELIAKYGSSLSDEEATATLQREVGAKFAQVLEDAGVYKRDEAGQAAFVKFLRTVIG